MQTKILEVVTVDLVIAKTYPPTLCIIATGNVSSSGWKNGQLIPYVYVMPPADGIYDFDFVAEAPKGQALDVILPIVANGEWQDFPSDLKGVRIHASSNNMEELLSDAKEAKILKEDLAGTSN